jgi:hypothetical protein
MPLFTVTMKSNGSTNEKDHFSRAIHAASIAAGGLHAWQSRQQNTLHKQRSLRWSSLLKRTPAHSRKSGQTGESRARENGSN